MKKPKIIIISIISVCLAALIANWIYCVNTFEIKNYNFKSDKFDTALRFVYLSDLHNKQYGAENCKLVSKIKEQDPDFIAVGGDMVSSGIDDDSVMKTLLIQLADIAPTYCILGNHELRLADKIDFENDINNTGALLLDNESIEFEKNGETILIGGLSDFPFYEGYAPDFDTPERYFWDEFKENSKNQYSILLHHQPEYLESIATDSGIDLIMCCHTHGGQIQLPFIGGVFAPNQGLFPKYDKGEFDLGSTKMIIAAGLGSTYPIPRINNCYELTTVNIS